MSAASHVAQDSCVPLQCSILLLLTPGVSPTNAACHLAVMADANTKVSHFGNAAQATKHLPPNLSTHFGAPNQVIQVMHKDGSCTLSTFMSSQDIEGEELNATGGLKRCAQLIVRLLRAFFPDGCASLYPHAHTQACLYMHTLQQLLQARETLVVLLYIAHVMIASLQVSGGCTFVFTCMLVACTSRSLPVFLHAGSIDVHGVVGFVCMHTIPARLVFIDMPSPEQWPFYLNGFAFLLKCRPDIEDCYLDFACKISPTWER